MKNPIFLKVITADGAAECFVPMPKQTYKVGTEDREVDKMNMVIPRDSTLQKFEEGEVWATDSLVKKSQGWYVAGDLLYKITDEVGIIFSSAHEWIDDTHRDWCLRYESYNKGKSYDGDEAVEEGAKKPKRQVKTLLEKLHYDRRLSPPTVEDDGWYVDRDLWYFLLRSYKKNKNTLLIGASGAGKTELIMFMMAKIKKDLSIFDMAVSNPNKTFCGNLRAENGSTYFQLARFANEIQKENLIVLDELSRAAPTANNIFLPVLDNRRTLYIEDAIDDKDREILVAKKCTFWATANIGAEFVGTSTLDHALLNRFQQVGLTYPPPERESKLLQVRYSLDKNTSDTLVAAVNNIRKNTELSKDISTRQLFDIAELVADGYTPLEAFKWSVVHQFEGNEHDGGERQTVLAILQSL